MAYFNNINTLEELRKQYRDLLEMQAFYYSMEDKKAMRAKPVTADEQYRLIMECRSSGLTGYQWCLEHNIKPGTFYNWVKRLRQLSTSFL